LRWLGVIYTGQLGQLDRRFGHDLPRQAIRAEGSTARHDDEDKQQN
jgi:hypothetical protein